MWKVLVLLFCTILNATGAAKGQDQRGKQFMLSFIHPNKPDGNPILLISAEDRASVTITIPSLDLILINDIEPGETWKPTLSRDLRYKAYFTTARSAVNVTSTTPVTVYVYDGVKSRSSGYMALPVHALSTSYIAVTYTGRQDKTYPVFLLVAIMNDTTVDVLFRLSSGQCDGHTTGQTSTHTLHAYDVYGVRCTGDFTGTYIVSNKPLVIISGHQNTNISGFFDDTLQEMLIPVDQFGLSFVLIEPRGSTRGSINRIVSSSDNTEVCSSTGETFLLNAYEYVDIDTGISGQQCINSNFPVLVVSFTKSKNGGSYDTIVIDAAMYIVPATSMFTKSIYVDFGLSTELNIAEFVSIAFVFGRNDTPDFSTSTVHEAISRCPYDVYTMRVTEWPVRFSGGSFTFGAYLFGNNEVRHNGVAFPLNMAFASGLMSASHLSLCTTESRTIQPSLSHSPGVTAPSEGITSPSTFIRAHQSSQSSGVTAPSEGITSPSTFIRAHQSSQSSGVTAPSEGITSPSTFIRDRPSSHSPGVTAPFTASVSRHMISVSYAKRASSASINLKPIVTGETLWQSSTTDVDQASAQNVPSLTISTSHSPETEFQSSLRFPLMSPRFFSSFSSLSLFSMTLHSSFSLSSFPFSSPTSYPTPSFSLPHSSSSFFVPLSSSVTVPSSTYFSSSLTPSLPHSVSYSFIPGSSSFFRHSSPSPSSSSSSTSLPPAVSLSPLPFSTLFSFYSSSPLFASSSHGVYELTSSVPQQKVCSCLCKTHASWNITYELFEMIRKNITDLLLLEPTNLSKTIRKLTSAQDNRPSVIAIGSVGTAFIVVTIVLIFVPDVMSGLRYLFAKGKTHPKVFQFVRIDK